MRLVSPKTLLASLLGCTVVALKVMTFDGPSDIVWILFIGYLSVKGLTAFSREAYDEDVKQARQGKVLYRDLVSNLSRIFLPPYSTQRPVDIGTFQSPSG